MILKIAVNLRVKPCLWLHAKSECLWHGLPAARPAYQTSTAALARRWR